MTKAEEERAQRIARNEAMMQDMHNSSKKLSELSTPKVDQGKPTKRAILALSLGKVRAPSSRRSATATRAKISAALKESSDEGERPYES